MGRSRTWLSSRTFLDAWHARLDANTLLLTCRWVINAGLSGNGAKWRRRVPPPRRLTTRESTLPWAIFSFPWSFPRVNHPTPLSGNPCLWQCFLKGCERWFLPRHFQDCYCSPNWRIAARRWRRWHAAKRYRATTHGKQRRREQARRHRERKRLRSALNEPALPTPEVEPALSAIVVDAPPLIDPPTSC